MGEGIREVHGAGGSWLETELGGIVGSSVDGDGALRLFRRGFMGMARQDARWPGGTWERVDLFPDGRAVVRIGGGGAR